MKRKSNFKRIYVAGHNGMVGSAIIKDLKKNGLDKDKFIKSINNLKFSNKVVNF